MSMKVARNGSRLFIVGSLTVRPPRLAHRPGSFDQCQQGTLSARQRKQLRSVSLMGNSAL